MPLRGKQSVCCLALPGALGLHQCQEIAARLFLCWKCLCLFLLSCIHVSFRTHSLLILLSIIVTMKKNLPCFWSSRIYIVLSFMPETRNISDSSDTRLHSQGFHFRNYSGNSEWWASRMESVQIPHYLVLCMKKCLTIQDQGECKIFH